MKIRWTRESVRFRITPSECSALLRGETVQEALPLPDGGVWSARIVPTAAEVKTQLRSASREAVASLEVLLSAGDRAQLSEPECEGIYFPRSPDGSGDRIRYYIEKDFPCIHPRPLHAHEPETETFEAPPDFAQRKGVATA